MNTEHTTETWTAYQAPEDVGTNYWRIRFADGLGGSMCGYCGEKRARLAAAAPDLLEALEQICELQEKSECSNYEMAARAYDMRCIARAAIAKAEGKA